MTVRARLPRPSDDRGSMPMVILVSLIGLTLGALMLTMIVTQTRSTRFDTSRVHALDAAQSGIDVALGQIRASLSAAPAGPDPNTGVNYGNAAALPCGPIAKTNANSAGAATYSVTITYLNADGSTWTCGSASGAPGSAVITSVGTDGAAVNGASKGRTLTTTYVFRASNPTLPPGGQLTFYGTNNCLDAGASTADIQVLMQPCSSATPPAASQIFAYRSDLTIALMSSVTVKNAAGLCLDTDTTNTQLRLEPCTSDPQSSNQQWAFDANGHFAGWKTGSCMTGRGVGVAVAVGGCSGSAFDPTQTFVPSASTGSGMAGAATNQIANYQTVGRCIDDTGADPNATYLILWSCKQSQVPGNIDRNQKFTPALGPPSPTALPQTGTLSINNGTSYCLRDPVTGSSYPTLSTNCTLDSGNTWTWNQTLSKKGTDGTSTLLPYAQMYTITDSAGLCLGAGSLTDLYNNQFQKLIVTTCDGDTDQKWNADPRVMAAASMTTKEN